MSARPSLPSAVEVAVTGPGPGMRSTIESEIPLDRAAAAALGATATSDANSRTQARGTRRRRPPAGLSYRVPPRLLLMGARAQGQERRSFPNGQAARRRSPVGTPEQDRTS